jgi:very-short-patch-repair endonuclease
LKSVHHMFKNKTELDNIFWENVRTLVLSLKFRTQMILSQMLNLVIFKKNATSIWLHF